MDLKTVTIMNYKSNFAYICQKLEGANEAALANWETTLQQVRNEAAEQSYDDETSDDDENVVAAAAEQEEAKAILEAHIR